MFNIAISTPRANSVITTWRRLASDCPIAGDRRPSWQKPSKTRNDSLGRMCHERAELQSEHLRGNEHADYRTWKLSPWILDCITDSRRSRDCGVVPVVAFEPGRNRIAAWKEFCICRNGGDGTGSTSKHLKFRARFGIAGGDEYHARDTACSNSAHTSAYAEHRRRSG